MTTNHELLAMLNRRQEIIELGDATNAEELCNINDSMESALRAVVKLIKSYLEHDIKNVTKVNGVYDKEQAEAWEKVHGHDIRLNCYPEFGCQLLIDPEDLFLAIEKELG